MFSKSPIMKKLFLSLVCVLMSMNLAQAQCDLNFDYVNTGNSISKCTGYVEFRDIDGLPVKKIELDDIPKIYPAEKRHFQVPNPNNLESGEYFFAISKEDLSISNPKTSL